MEMPKSGQKQRNKVHKKSHRIRKVSETNDEGSVVSDEKIEAALQEALEEEIRESDITTQAVGNAAQSLLAEISSDNVLTIPESYMTENEMAETTSESEQVTSSLSSENKDCTNVVVPELVSIANLTVPSIENESLETDNAIPNSTKQIKSTEIKECTKVDPSGGKSGEKNHTKVVEKTLSRRTEDKISARFDVIKPFTESQLAALHSNQELEQGITVFIQDFLALVLQHNDDSNDPLSKCLAEYLLSKTRLGSINREIHALRHSAKDLEEKIWTLQLAVISKKGQCEDNNTVTGIHKYQVANFNQNTMNLLSKTYHDIVDKAYNGYTLQSYYTVVFRRQIEYYITCAINDCQRVARIGYNAPVQVLDNIVPPALLQRIRKCLSILFAFQRRQISDAEFLSDTRGWIEKLSAILLRIASWQDHLFLLNHILRCPGGVSNWAAHLVQAPCPQTDISSSPFSDPQINHVVTVMATILLPIQQRIEFLAELQVHQVGDSTENVWVVVDSDGEEDDDTHTLYPIREADIVALLNQVPVEDLFRNLLRIVTRDMQDVFDDANINENYLLRLLAWCSSWVSLLRRGLQTYSTRRYAQLTKLLSRFVVHTIQYVTDLWIIFRSKIGLHNRDEAMMKRLQVEYNALFTRATECVFSCRRLGAWQFLAVLPFEAISTTTLWEIYYMLHDGTISIERAYNPPSNNEWKQQLCESSFRQGFEAILIKLSDVELYYLLLTFANMAMARSIQDREFIESVTINILQIGFFSPTLQDKCAKSTRDLLASLTMRHPALISNIYVTLQNFVSQIGQWSLYLFKELPLFIWTPSTEDFQHISHGLIASPIVSHENNLSRYIITNLNWDFDENKLFLPHAMHLQTAFMIVHANSKHYENGLTKGSETATIWDNWIWKTVIRLRLHVLDQDDLLVKQCFADPCSVLNVIPEVDNLELLSAGVKEKQLLPSFVALLVTQWGHTVPLICCYGFDLMHFLLSSTRYDEVIIALDLVVPLFMNCVDSLVQCDKFMKLITALFAADRSYCKMAKNLIISDTPGPIITQFGNMVQNHLEKYKSDYFENVCAKLWQTVIINIPNWHKDCNATYILDIVMRFVFFSPNCIEQAEHSFRNILQKQNMASEQKSAASSGITSLFSWMTSNETVPTLVTGASVNCPWLTYFLHNVEHNELEIRTGLWRELLVQMANSKGKTNVDQSLKRAAAIVKSAAWGSGQLSIYRIAQQAMDTTLGHPILPLLWQKFFELFLARVPATARNVDQGGVGNKFFDGVVNTTYLKKIKRRLLDIVADYETKAREAVKVEQAEYFSNCANLFKTFGLWLEETRFHERNVNLPALPPQYDSQKMILIFQGTSVPWLRYVNREIVKDLSKEMVDDWVALRCRNQIKRPVSPMTKLLTPDDHVNRLYRRLKSYDTPKPPPTLSRWDPIIPDIPRESMTNASVLITFIKPQAKIIQNFARSHDMRLSEHLALISSLRELIPQLYNHVTKVLMITAPCKNSTVSHCGGPAKFYVEITESFENSSIKINISATQSKYENVLGRCFGNCSEELSTASCTIHQTINFLESEYKLARSINEVETFIKIQQVGVNVFYSLLTMFDEEMRQYAPSVQLFTSCIKTLGMSFISGWDSETVRLVTTGLSQPKLADILTPLLNPPTNGDSFLVAYGVLMKRICISSPQVVHLFLAKFEVDKWLNDKKPRLCERAEIIEGLVRSLIILGYRPVDDDNELHERLRKHLLIVFSYEWPEHYGEILQALLRASNGDNENSGSISEVVWKDILRTLGLKSIRGQGLTEEIRQYATTQNLLKHQELIQSAAMLGEYFKQERLKYGLYGLYPRYRAYVVSITTLLGMIGHALVVSTMQQYPGLLADKVCEIILPALMGMFSPWLVPYWTQHLKDTSATWIQQLTDGRAALAPWIQTDSPHAQHAIICFINTIRFVMDMLPTCNSVLSFVWQFYAMNFAHPAIKEHVLAPVHAGLSSLPWDRFWPSILDLEIMLKIFDQYLPDCHVFTGCTAMRVSWLAWMEVVEKDGALTVARAQNCLLPLIVKLAIEPAVRNNSKELQTLLSQASKGNWKHLDAETYNHLINWYIMSGDPRSVLNTDISGQVDNLVVDLLKVGAEFSTAGKLGPFVMQKRQIFVRGFTRLLILSGSKYKTLASNDASRFRNTIAQILLNLEQIIRKNPVTPGSELSEISTLLTELLVIADDQLLAQLSSEVISQWLTDRADESFVMEGVLNVLGTVPQCPNAIGSILEAALVGYFNVKSGTWSEVVQKLKGRMLWSTKRLPVVMAQNGHILAAHAVILLRSKDNTVNLSDIIEVTNAIKPNQAVESKIPLIWCDVLNLAKMLVMAAEEISDDQTLTEICNTLREFTNVLDTNADDKSGWGASLLGAIGIRNKQYGITNRFRFLCRVLSVYLRAQLPGVSIIRCGGHFLEENTWVSSIRGLDSLRTTQGDLKVCAELAIKQIQDPKNSLHNAEDFLISFAQQLYSKSYLRTIK